MPRKKKVQDQDELENMPLGRILARLDAKVQARGEAVLDEVDLTREIVQLVSAARRRGATMPDLAERVKRMDKKERVLKPISRQALDMTIATEEKRREPRTTRASRRRRKPETVAVDGVNAEAFS
jgi:hypothetical protein